MRLICRECSAIYEAPDELFGNQPREVRCNRCGYQWIVPTSPPSPAPAFVPAPAPDKGNTEDRHADTRDSDTRPITPQPVATPPEIDVPAAAPSTRALLEGQQAATRAPGVPDPEERRLAHDVIFDSPHSSTQRRGGGAWGLWLAAMVIIVLVIAAILFEPQLVNAIPALAKIYAVFGL